MCLLVCVLLDCLSVRAFVPITKQVVIYINYHVMGWNCILVVNVNIDVLFKMA